MRKFILKEEHLKLLSRAFVGWQNCDAGAPEINPKRPYGNSDVESDIANILNWDLGVDGEISDEQFINAENLHKETKIALQIVLRLKTFETGEYVKKEDWSTKWEKA